MSRHGSDRVLRRPRWTSAVAVAGIAALVGLGASLAVWHPIVTPSAASPLPTSTAPPAQDLSTPTTPSMSALSSDPSTTKGALAGSSTTATATSRPATMPPVAGVAAPPPTVVAGASSGTRTPAIAAGQPCRPVRFSMAPLGIDATVVTLSLTAEGDLGTPSDADRRSAGWFPSVLAGSARGTVLMDGHTYHDGSAIFPTTFKRQVQPGMLMRLACADGHAFSYRVTEVVTDLTPASYPGFVQGRSLYAADGPAQLVMVTCTDYLPAQRVWANRAVVVAVPVS